MTFEEKASFGDKQSISSCWILIIKQATMARINCNNPEFYRCVDTLTIVLLSKHRKLVKEYKKQLMEAGWKDLALYDVLLEYTVDVLETAGYLTKTSIIETGGGMLNEVVKTAEEIKEELGDE